MWQIRLNTKLKNMYTYLNLYNNNMQSLNPKKYGQIIVKLVVNNRKINKDLLSYSLLSTDYFLILYLDISVTLLLSTFLHQYSWFVHLAFDISNIASNTKESETTEKIELEPSTPPYSCSLLVFNLRSNCCMLHHQL
jgi:hypothetical protein